MMIKSNEIRVGNKLLYHRTENVTEEVTVSWVSDDSIGYYEEHEASYPHSFKQYSGIPITPEWLERLGVKANTFRNAWQFEANEELYLMRLYDDGFYVSIEYDKMGRLADKTFAFGIKYVHQLQNLYFALTGEELIINE